MDRCCRPVHMLAILIVVLLLAASCGGKTVGSAHGSVESGGANEGGTIVDSGGDAGSNDCQPLPGCSSTSECPAGDGCNSCSCGGGQWVCTKMACVDGGPLGDAASDSPPDVTAPCPASVPPEGQTCGATAMTCQYQGACVQRCVCSGSGTTWACNHCQPPCPAPIPSEGSSCSGFGGVLCLYPPSLPGCAKAECSCDGSNGFLWSCPNDGCFSDGGAD
jgi:hypothetical protein